MPLLGGFGGMAPQKFFEIWNPQVPFPAFWASKLDVWKSTCFSHQNKKKTRKSYKIYSSAYHFEQQII
jgi:hypothetical protein